MAMPAQGMYVPQFFMRQQFTLMVNRYQLFSANPDGTEGHHLLAFAEQKRMALKEQVTFFADEAKTRPVFGFKARTMIDLNAGYDVTDPNGAPIGWFKKDFAKSLVRSSWHLSAAGIEAFGTERNATIAILRRVGISSPTWVTSGSRSCFTSTSPTRRHASGLRYG